MTLVGALVHGSRAASIGRLGEPLAGRVLRPLDRAMKSRVHPTFKTRYRVGDWRVYERALVSRGDVTLWLSRDAMAAWSVPPSGRPGGQQRFSDLAIETALTLRLVFGLPFKRRVRDWRHAAARHLVFASPSKDAARVGLQAHSHLRGSGRSASERLASCRPSGRHA